MDYRKILNECIDKVKSDVRNISDDIYENGRSIKHIFSWTQGFVTGMAGIAYQLDKDESLLKMLYGVYDSFNDKVTLYPEDTMHDLGFLYSPYAVMMHKICNDSKMGELTIKAADCLIRRYVPKSSYIRAWGRMDDTVPEYVDKELAKDHFFTKSTGLAIVDCMMNLPLLFRASKISGRPIYKNIAIEHIETTLKYFIRDDDTVYHAYRFSDDGLTQTPENFCGFGVDSAWARGTTWIIYGLAIAYRYTGDIKYLETSIKLFKKFIELCGDALVPIWDFRLPTNKPAKSAYVQNSCPWDESSTENIDCARDTSASAVAVCAAQEILKFSDDSFIRDYKEKTLKLLCDKYYNICDKGFLSNSDGRMNYSWYGDYYFMQALANETAEIVECW